MLKVAEWIDNMTAGWNKMPFPRIYWLLMIERAVISTLSYSIGCFYGRTVQKARHTRANKRDESSVLHSIKHRTRSHIRYAGTREVYPGRAHPLCAAQNYNAPVCAPLPNAVRADVRTQFYRYRRSEYVYYFRRYENKENRSLLR